MTHVTGTFSLNNNNNRKINKNTYNKKNSLNNKSSAFFLAPSSFSFFYLFYTPFSPSLSISLPYSRSFLLNMQVAVILGPQEDCSHRRGA